MPQGVVVNNRTISQQLGSLTSGCDTKRGRWLNREMGERNKESPLNQLSQGNMPA